MLKTKWHSKVYKYNTFLHEIIGYQTTSCCTDRLVRLYQSFNSGLYQTTTHLAQNDESDKILPPELIPVPALLVVQLGGS